MKKVYKIPLIVLVAVAVIGGLFWYLWTHQNIGLNKDYLLRKSVQQYSDLIDVGNFDQAFDFLTPDAKAKTKTREIRDFNAEAASKCPKANIFDSDFSKYLEASRCRDNAYTVRQETIPAIDTFKDYAGKRKNNWSDLTIEKIVFTGNHRADVRFTYKELGQSRNAPETWYYVNGKWLRDF